MDAGSPRLALLPMAALLNAVDTVEASNYLMREPESADVKTPEPPSPAFPLPTAASETPAPDQAAPPPTVDPAALRDAGDSSSSKTRERAAEDPTAAPMEIDEPEGKPVKASSTKARARKAQPKNQHQPGEPPAPTKRASRRTRQPSAKMQSLSPPPPPKRSKTTPASRTPSVDRSSPALLQYVAVVDATPAAKPTRAARKRRSTAETPAAAPPLPPTPATAAAPPASKATRAKASAPASLKRSHSTTVLADNTLTPSLRICELCKQVNNICASFYCSCCRRVYHAQCFAQSLAPYYDKTQRIELQMDALRLNAPKHQVSMLRCNSCKAAFIEFTRGGYQWDCDCITCKQPEKLLGYRSFTLLEMMRDMAEERKQKKKGGGAKAAAAGKAPAAATADSKKKANSRRAAAAAAPVGIRQSRRVAAQETAEPEVAGAVAEEDQAADEVAEAQEKKPSIVIEMSADEGNEDDVVEVDEHGVEALVLMKENKSLNQVETVDDSDEKDIVRTAEREPVTNEEPEREHEGVSRKSPSSPAAKPRKMPKGRGLEAAVSGNGPRVNVKAKKAHADEGSKQEEVFSRTETKALYADVNMTVEDTSRSFRVTCTENPDFRTGGILKEAVFTWNYKGKPEIKCECCQGVFSQTSHFVNHTSDAFLKEPTTKSASDFLFVQHQRSGNLSPLSPFIMFLRNNMPTQSKPTTNAKRLSKKAASSPVQDELLTKALESERLNNAEIFRVKRVGQKSSDETFGIRVVCMDRTGSVRFGGRYSIEHPSAPTTLTRARKAGYLLFNATGKEKYKGVFCDCCNQLLPVEDFVLHTLEDWDRKFKDKYLFVENSNDSLMFNELADLWAPLEQLKLKSLLAVYLKKRVKDTIDL